MASSRRRHERRLAMENISAVWRRVGTELCQVPLSRVDWTGRGPYFAVKLEFYYSSICREYFVFIW